ncbi:hypothetical protein D6764_05360 [Candidatus Woesearchaeota archaeon]|nr:MAG: hypothetical protein D6764_05360 [Candidatus Woesearchaeota archaeon]
MALNVTQEILKILDENNLEYDLINHAPVYTSKDAAKARGTELSQGAKSLIWKVKNEFVMTVAPAHKKVDVKKLASVFNVEDSEVSLARPKEVRQLTYCNIGSVPPFGHVFGVKVVIDPSLFENDWIAFNAGSHTSSIKMKAKDYRRLVAESKKGMTADIVLSDFEDSLLEEEKREEQS